MIGTATWMNLKGIQLGRRNQAHKATHCMIYCIHMTSKKRAKESIVVQNRTGVTRSYRQGEKEGVSEIVLSHDCDDGYMNLHTC